MTGPASDKACIVGAGPAGLATARTLRHFGIPYDQFERHTSVGGIWDPENPGSPMYASAHFISSRTQSAYYDFPMPETYPDFPRHDQILDYVRSFAKTFDLVPGITFGTAVSSAERFEEGWRITLSTGETKRYRWLICVNGHTWDPVLPEYPGTFSGVTMHAVDYRDPQVFRGKRVLIVGAGNSACDIACDAAQNAAAAFISMRRGYHFVPKHIFGKPADAFLASGPKMPAWLAQAVFGRLLRMLNGDLTRYGLQAPDHKILESHPIVNSQLLHHLSHGDIAARRDIERFDGDGVVFKDGAREAIDLVLYATGYRYSVPYVREDVFEWNGYKPKLAYGIFNAREPRIFCLGFIEMNAGGWYTYDQMAFLIAQAIETDRAGTNFDGLQQRLHQPVDMSGGIHFVPSQRHADYYDAQTFQKHTKRLCRDLSWKLPGPGTFRR